MDSLTIATIVWIVCGGLAWYVAKKRHGSGPLWMAIGQIFGPLAIPFAFLVKPERR